MLTSFKHFRIVALLLAIATIIPAGGSTPALAATESPWDAPKPANLSEEQVKEFLDLWAPRIQNESFMEAYVKAPAVPAEIQAEGFHGLDGDSRRWLTKKLYDQLSSEIPELAIDVASAKASGNSAYLDQQRSILELFVFEKEWVKELHDKAVKPKATAVDKMPMSDELRTSIDSMGRAKVTTPDAPVVDGITSTTVRTTGLIENMVQSLTPDFPAPPSVPRESSTTPYGLGMYQICFDGSAGGYTCSADFPYGVPIDVDLDGGGPDIRGQLLPVIDPLDLNKLGVQVTFEKINPLAAVGGYVAARADIIMANKRVEVGFSAADLAKKSSVSAVVNNLAQAAAGIIDVTTTIAHDTPSTANALEVRVSSLDYAASLTAPGETDRILATLNMTPVPATISANLKMNRLASDYRVNVTSSAAFRMDPVIAIEEGATPGPIVRQIYGSINPVPSTIDVHFALLPTGGFTTEYAASTTTDISFYDFAFANGLPTKAIYGAVDNLPANISMQFTPGEKVIYNASSSITRVDGASATFNAAGVLSEVMSGYVKGIPSSFTVDFANAPDAISFDASAVTPEAGGSYFKAGGDQAFVTVTGIPASIDLAINDATQKITWVSSSPTTSLTVGAILTGPRTTTVSAKATSIPASWEASFAAGRPLFRGISGPIGSLEGYLTNHGSYTSAGGNYATVNYSSATGNLDAGFRMVQVNLADIVQTASGFTADLRMGGAQPLTILGNVLNGTTKMGVSTVLTPLPTSIQLSHTNGDFTYTSDMNFTLNSALEFGHAGGIAAAPAAPLVLGASVRDGFGCVVASTCGNGIKARIYILGFPKGITATPAAATGPKVVISAFAPPAGSNSLTLDVDLDNIVSPRTRLTATQYGIPTPVTFTLGPIQTSTLGGGEKQTTAAYTATGALGAFVASLERGTDVGYLYISNIPSSIAITATIANGTSTIAINNSAPINQIQALFRRTADVSFQGGATLTDVPSVLSLSFGRISVTSGSDSFTVPGFNYTANASTLDLSAFVNASLMGGNVQAAGSFLMTNLGAASRGYLEGTNKLRLISTPATSNIELHTWGRISYLRSFSGCIGGCGFFRLQYGGHAGVVPVTINDLAVQVTSLSDMTVTLGITSAITGNYGTFRFGWNSIVAAIDVEASVEACVSSFCLTIVGVSIHTTVTVNILFHLATNHSAGWYHISTPIPCSLFPPAAYDVHVDLRPHPHFTQYNGFTVSAASSEGGWLVTPNPFGIIPGLAVEVAAGYTSPLGGGLSVSFPCH